jgi:predicted dehydrogenase
MTIRLIHVGVGVRGRHWLDVVALHGDFTSVAYVDSSDRALAAVRAHSQSERGRFFTDLPTALSQVEADAVLIASPTPLHARHAIESLEAGLAVLVEKPIAVGLADAVAVVERSRAVGRPVVVAENYRFFPAERTLHRLLADGIAGQLASAVCVDCRDQPARTQGPWVKSMRHPFLTEIAVHHFDSFRYLFGTHPTSMLVTSHNPPGSTYDQNAATQALIELEPGFPIQYSGTMIATRYEFELWIEGEKGELWTDRRRVRWRPGGRNRFHTCMPVPVPAGDELPYPKAGTVSLLNQFRDAVRHGAKPETGADDNLWTVAMVEAGIVSDRDGRKVMIDEVFTPALKRRAGLMAT